MFGPFSHLFPDLFNDEKKFYNYFRMSFNLFFTLNSMIVDEVSKQKTNYREAISSEQRLAIFLR
jgi:hypothetical protein